MKIHQYFSILAVLVAVLFLAAASTPTTSFAASANSKQTKTKACQAKVSKKPPHDTRSFQRQL